MHDLITSFIIQSKECKLPGIGKFRLTTTPAEPDIANQQIIPPVIEFLFTGREEKISNELINYIAVKKSIPSAEAQARIKEWCTDAGYRLKAGEEIFLPSLGSLKKGASGNIFFHRQKDIPFFVPVPAERVIHKNSVHAVLVGDRETNSTIMNQLLNEEEEVQRDNAWKIIAIVLFLIALSLLFFYFYQHSFSLSSLGNQGKISPQAPPATYMTK
jgi:nucleoid DNA-binding protein